MENVPSDNLVVELFAGVGGFNLGLAESGWKTVFANQWEPGKKNQWAFDCYDRHFKESFNSNIDVAAVPAKDIPAHELLVGGFPCQDYSVASTLANSKGIQGKKGVLWWEIYRLASNKKPRFILLENVDRLLKSPAKQRGRDFGIILACLTSLGYSVEWRVINAADYGFPQRRRRTFIFATRDKSIQKALYVKKTADSVLTESGFFAPSFKCRVFEDSRIISKTIGSDIKAVSDAFTFPFENSGYCVKGECSTLRVEPDYDGKRVMLGDIIQNGVDEKYYIKDADSSKWEYMKGAKKEKRVSPSGYEYVFTEGPIAYPDPLDKPSRTMLTSESSKNRSTHVIRDPGTGRLRLLTPVECERLNGFPDGWTEGMPEKMRYFCMGNALVVGLIAIMGKRIKEVKDLVE